MLIGYARLVDHAEGRLKVKRSEREKPRLKEGLHDSSLALFVEITYMEQRIIYPFIAYSSIDNERDGVNLMTINAQETFCMRYSFLPGQNEKNSCSLLGMNDNKLVRVFIRL